MGPEATAANEALVADRTVIEKDVREIDDLGRLLRYVWLPGSTWTLVNLELVREGFASVATYPPDVKYVELIRAAEQDARDVDAGLWRPTPAPTPAPTPLVALIAEPVVAGENDSRAVPGRDRDVHVGRGVVSRGLRGPPLDSHPKWSRLWSGLVDRPAAGRWPVGHDRSQRR